ncbi:MAG: ester cyclase [Bradyrhizobium sp.]|nr:ester cyclase [Bradyrhizobium sp.]
MNLIVTDPASRETASIASGAANEIEFLVGDCVLGKVLVARSPIGVCAIRFGSTAAELEQDLTASFPDGRIVSTNRRLRDDLTKVLQFIAVPRDPLDLDLDIRGTPFQRRVWDALRTIPFGKPLTYAQLACRVSGPKSLRAIAQACAENPIALAIPCHRVMGNSGSMAGYRWGIERKQALINREVATRFRCPSATGRHSPASFDLRTTTGVQPSSARSTLKTSTDSGPQPKHTTGEVIVSKEEDNKAIVGRWFTDFWGKTCNLGIVDELAASDMLLQYSLHEPRRGREDIKAFMTDFRKAFPDLNFWGAADLIAEGDYVVGRWEGGGTHSGQAFSDFLAGSLPANTGRKMKFTGTTVLKLKDGKILEEIGLDDGVTALQQLGLIRAA